MSPPRLTLEHRRWAARWEASIADRVRARSAFSPSAQQHFREPFSDDEVERYRRDVIAVRPPRWQAALRAASEAFALRSDTRLVVAIPVFALERTVERSLSSYLHSTQDLSLTEFLLFVNASEAQCSPEVFRTRLSGIRGAVRRVAARAGGALRAHVIAHHAARKRPMGAVRALMHDAIVEAGLRCNNPEITVLFNDCDQLAVAPGTLARTREAFAAEPHLDLVCMPISHGYEPDGTSHLAAKVLAPELLLGVRFNHAAWLATRFDQSPLEWLLESDGGSFAVRLASLCALGGFDVERAQGEDNDIALKIKALRRVAERALESDGAAPPHLAFDAASLVVSDPRRVLNAIVNGRTANEAWRWRPFAEHEGCRFSVPRLLQRYARAEALLQSSHLAALNPLAPSDFVLSRVLRNLFRAPFRNPLVRTEVGYRQVGSRFGVEFQRIVVDAGGGVRELAIDLRRSTLFELLRAWATQ